MQLGETKGVHYRRVSSALDFAEGMGGLFAIIQFFVTFTSFLFVCRSYPIEYSRHIFRVNKEHPKTKMRHEKKVEA